ncbi:RHS repeat-associated protein [Catenulispora sp. GAS73]|uniref:RHS repeat-associated core domain-containing protein n=1 Tax=Catenulispora sp. GAS73 TaxID=3156269 RepID=UPI00351658A5
MLVRPTAWLTALAVGSALIASAVTETPVHAAGRPPRPAKWNGHSMAQQAAIAGAPLKAVPVKGHPVAKGAPVTETTFPAAASDDLQIGAPASTKPSTADATASADGGTGTPVHSNSVPISVASVASPAARTDASAVSTLTPPTSVQVTVAGHDAAISAGVTGEIVTVARSDGQTAAAKVKVAVDYGSFAEAYGGDYSTRLKLVALPACALTTPRDAACQKQTPVTFSNDIANKQLVATITLPAGPAPTTGGETPSATSTPAKSPTKAKAAPMILAATSSATGSAGAYTATSLAASNQWGESGNTGSFTYQYPITTPASLDGAGPPVALSYDSGSVDGHNSVENGQVSWIGDGWDYSPGFIERSYSPCTKAKPTAYPTSGDNCFARDSSGKLLPALTMSFGAHGGQLVHDDSDTSNSHFKLATDDGTQIDVLTGTTNGTVAPNGATGEYIRVRLPSGAVAYFGADKLPAEVNNGSIGTDTPTQSTWSEPVFNNPTVAACQDPTKSSAVGCSSAWRWNLDYVISPTGMVTKYLYSREHDLYGRSTSASTSNSPTDYTRAGQLAEIDYGWTTADVAAGHQPAAKVKFTSLGRCIDPNWDGGYGATSGGSAGCASPTGSIQSGLFQDTPTDFTICEQPNTTTCALTQPTFWSARMLGSITTQVSVNGAYQNVDHYDLFHQFHTLVDSDTEANRPPLWLAAIRHCAGVAADPGMTCADGESGANGARAGITDTTSMPDVVFSPAPAMPNRVALPTSSVPWYFRERLGWIDTELNGVIAVNYDSASAYPLGCTAAPAVADWHNTKLCYPEYWTPPGQSAPLLDWFNKYVVTSIAVSDGTRATNQIQTTFYTYDATLGAAWHSNDSDLVTDPKTRTYDQYRGFQSVTTVVGTASANGSTTDWAGTPQSKSVTTYLRGMDQDPDLAFASKASTGSCSVADCPPVTVAVSNGFGIPITDDNAFSGMALETQTFTSATGTPWSDTVSRPWDSPPIAEHSRIPLPAQRSRQLGTTTAYSQVATADGGTRTTQTDYVYDTGVGAATDPTGSHGGRVLATWSHSPAYSKPQANPDTTPDMCTSTGYAVNPAKSWMLGFADDTTSWTTTPNGGCWAAGGVLSAPSNNQIVTEARSFYDNPALPNFLDQGLVRKTDVLDHLDTAGNKVFNTKTLTDYDGYGRVAKTTDALGNATITAYTPAFVAGTAGELPRQSIVTGPTGLAATTTLDPTRELATDIRDPNGNTTHQEYDALGRRLRVWLPDHPKSAFSTMPNLVFHYTVNGDTTAPATATTGATSTSLPSVVETDTLRENTSYNTSYSYVDSLGRTRQTQAVPPNGDPGRIITDTQYDSHGSPYLVQGPYNDPNAAPGANVWVNTAPVPQATQTLHDGMGRATQVQNLAFLAGTQVVLSHTDTAYPGADRVDASPTIKQGDPAPDYGRTSVYTDARGLKTALYTYRSGNPAFGDATNADITRYGYDNAGRMTAVTDLAGNKWSYSYNLQGLKQSANDPDAGASTFGYDLDGHLTDTQDGRGTQLHYRYDALGRKTGEWTGWGTGAETAANLQATWTFDKSATGSAVPNGLGQPTGSIRYSGGYQYSTSVDSYDTGGRVLSASVVVPNDGTTGALAGTYTTTNTYTPYTGQLYQTTLPTGGSGTGLQPDVVTNSYTNDGLLISAGDNFADLLWDSSYTPFGEVMGRVVGDYPSQITQTTNYDPSTRRILNVDVSATSLWAGGSIDHWKYAYRADGTVTGVQDQQGTAGAVSNNVAAVSIATDQQCFAYDYANRLTGAWTDADSTSFTVGDGAIGGCTHPQPSATNRAAATTQVNGGPAPYWQTFAYSNPIGDRSAETDYNPAGNTANDITTTYGYGHNGTQPHTLTSTQPSNQGTANQYVYDPSGNTISRPRTGTGTGDSLNWDAEGHLTSETNTTATPAVNVSFVYSADGTQLLRRDPGRVTLYLGSTELYLTGTQVTANRYFAYPGAPTIVETGGANPTVSYEVTNPQGTSQVSLNAGAAPANVVSARRAYTPFNTPRGNNNTTPPWNQTFPDDHTFLGKTTDTTTGLIDVGARKYDPNTGRFISADPLFQPGDPQSIGGYAYADNNPVDGTDPTGLGTDIQRYPGGNNTGTDADTSLQQQVQSCENSGGNWNGSSCAAPDSAAPETGAAGGQSPSTPTPTGPGNAAPAKAAALPTPAAPSPAENPDLYGPGNDSPFALIYAISGLEDAVHCFRDGSVKGCAFTALNAVPFAGKGLGMLADVIRIDAEASEIAEVASRVGAACGVHSFAADTQVLMADGTTKPIQSVAVGDEIENAEPGGAVEHHRVDQLHKTLTDKDFTDLTVSTPTGPKTVTSTQNHPYYDLTAGAFVDASQLKPGDHLQSTNAASVAVVSVRNYASSMVTYDLTIDGLHAYYVVAGDTPVLVHNTSGCGPIDLGNGLFQHPDGSIRDALGHFAGSNGVRVGAAAEAQVWDSLERQGMNVIRRPVAVRGNGDQLRIFDGAIDLGNGRVIGIEVKSGGASLTADQRAFDTWLNTSGDAASGVGLSSGSNAVGVYMWNVP